MSGCGFGRHECNVDLMVVLEIVGCPDGRSSSSTQCLIRGRCSASARRRRCGPGRASGCGAARRPRRAAPPTGSAKALKAKARDSLRDAGADEAAAKVKKSVERAGHAAREAVEAGAKEAAGQAAAAKSDVERALQDAKAKRGAAKAFKARLKESDAGTQDQRSSGACVVS